jgi:hypothetical protein
MCLKASWNLELFKGPHDVTRSNHHGFEPSGNKLGLAMATLSGAIKVIKARLFDSFIGKNEPR